MRKTINIGIAGVVIAAGGVVFALLVWTSPEAPRRERGEQFHDVAVVSIAPRTERSPVIGHGTVRPKKELDIVPLVPGKLVDVHRNLAVGKIIPKGELLFEIEPTVYEARVRQAEAEIRGFEAGLARQTQEEIALRERLATAHEMQRVEERDYLASKQLFEVEKVGTQREVDLVYSKYLRQKDVVSELESRQDMIPHIRREIEAKLDVARSSLAQARHELENTRIICPFRARVDAVEANRSQFVTAPFVIAKLTDMEAFEVMVGIDPRELRWLASSAKPSSLTDDMEVSVPGVRVRWALRGDEYVWRGRVTRFERIDEVTRTARMVVEVGEDAMLAEVQSGDADARPELAIGMFVATELPAEPLEDALLVPRHAIQDNRWVYVFEPDPASGDPSFGRLGRREVPILRSLGDEVLVDYRGRDGTALCELQGGDQVIISPMLKPVEGMKVRLRSSEQTARSDRMPKRVRHAHPGKPALPSDLVRLAAADATPVSPPPQGEAR